MRAPQKMFDLILNVAKNDERIRAVTLAGSRVNKNCPVDIYQDFDITFIVNDVSPFYDNEKWIEHTFGKPSLMQKPESMQLIPPDNDGKFVYLMIFADGNRIDLCVTCKKNYDESEPFEILLDKDNLFGKYLRNFLPNSIYQRFIKTYFTAETNAMWNGSFESFCLFGEVARTVAAKLDFTYNEAEEKAIENYMNQVKNGELGY